LTTQQNDRLERLLALLLVQNMRGATQAEKAVQLSLAGFTNVEIADLLGTTAAVVKQRLYEIRKNKAK
jgi:predicted transcriptional regulator